MVGLETQSELFFFALGSDGAITMIAKAETDLSGVTSLEYDREVGYLWAYCDDGCGNRAVILKLSSGRFEKRAELMRPGSLPYINNEASRSRLSRNVWPARTVRLGRGRNTTATCCAQHGPCGAFL